MKCEFVFEAIDDASKRAKCQRCSRTVVVPVAAETVDAQCRAGVSLPRVAVGDLVERMLTSLGITKGRVQAWTRVKDCGCVQRQRWLNQWGYQQQDRIERLLNKAAKWYGIS